MPPVAPREYRNPLKKERGNGEVREENRGVQQGMRLPSSSRQLEQREERGVSRQKDLSPGKQAQGRAGGLTTVATTNGNLKKVGLIRRVADGFSAI